MNRMREARASSLVLLAGILSAGAFVCGLSGCRGAQPSGHIFSGSLPHLDDASAQAAGLSPSEKDEAAQLYAIKCVRCHKSYDPSDYTEAQWQSWMSKMSRKAHLDRDQQTLLSRYLSAVRAATPRNDAKISPDS
jgi:hypothetical protein